jgi:hypothetical protein
MNTIEKILIFFLLPMIAPLLYPPETILTGYWAIILAVILFGGLGFLLIQGRAQALTLSIFLQGLNAITRIMMFFPHATYSDGSINIAYIVTAILSIGISTFLLLRLDRVDIRTQMVR